MRDTFIGRRSELARLHHEFEGVRGGQPCIVFVEGPPGIGKTALIRRFLTETGDASVLRAAGEELEAGLAFGLVEQLFQSVGLPGGTLPTGTRTGGVEVDALAVGATVAAALAELQRDRPVVVAVDDAQWADAASLHALGFAVRRLQGQRVLTVLSTRDTVTDRLPESLQRLRLSGSGVRLRLHGIDVPELRQLAGELGVGPLSRRAATRLHEHTQGNPLHVLALLEDLSAETLSDGNVPLPVPRSFAMLVLGRLAACSVDAERLVVAVAVLGGRCPIDLAVRLAQVDEPLAALEQAIAVHLLEERFTATERLVAFPHPLVRAAVYGDLGPARRSSLHARAAELVEAGQASLQHRIAAAIGTDPALAKEVATSAHRQAARGDWSAAADTLIAAARLSRSQRDKERHLLDAVEWLLVSGSTAEASALREQLRSFPVGARQRYVLGRLALVTGELAQANALLTEAWRRCDRRADPVLAARIAGQIANLRHVDGHATRGAAWARRALSADPAAADGQHALDVLLLAMGCSGRIGDGLSMAHTSVSPPVGADEVHLDGAVGRAVLRLWNGDAGAARTDLDATVEAYRRHGGAPVYLLLVALSALAEAEYRLGEWDDAVAHAELALATAYETQQNWLVARLHAVSAFVPVARGDWNQAEWHVRRAAASGIGDTVGSAYAATARGLLAAARDDPVGVVAALAGLDRSGRDWVGVPGILPWRELYVGALVELGHHDEAEAALGPLEEGGELGGAVALAASRLRGSLELARGHLAKAERSYRAGLEAAAPDQPLGQALLEFDYGRLLRRGGQRGAAAGHLSIAYQRFAELGARPYLERCSRELDACGTGEARRQPAAGRLTPQERAVARLVAGGCSNREAARQLVLSVKTVEFHLGNVFTKLGVRSRSQLILKLPNTGELS